MQTIPLSSFESNTEHYTTLAVNSDMAIKITTEKGNAVLIGEKYYSSLLETLYLTHDPKVYADILTGASFPAKDCTPEENITW